MPDWNALKDKALGVTRSGVGKAKELGEIARLNLDSRSEEEKIRNAYTEIGQRYWELNQDNPQPGFELLFEKIAMANAAIAENKEKIAKIKSDGDVSDEEIQELEIIEEKPEE